jgi:hypothetical protein
LRWCWSRGHQRLHVCEQVQDGELGPLKDDETRIVPVQAALLPILKAWKVRTGGEGLAFKPRFGAGPSRRACPGCRLAGFAGAGRDFGGNPVCLRSVAQRAREDAPANDTRRMGRGLHRSPSYVIAGA